AGNFATLHDFLGPEGKEPDGGLVLGPGGLLYGTTKLGGSSDFGTVFSITTAGELTTVYTFLGASDGASPFDTLALAADGSLYGHTAAVIQEMPPLQIPATAFRIDSSGGFSTIHTFVSPEAHPTGPFTLGADGQLYGVSSDEFPNLFGEIFRLDLPDGTFHVVYAPPDSRTPLSPLTGPIEGPDGLYALAKTGFG